ncbi:MAG: elongation factor P--(R)-beta-lysine ligase [Proteobacteria bacterium]|nr:elongation factor P--(R)-beta-lysine ligase [Pseudomonadota bacterium]
MSENKKRHPYIIKNLKLRSKIIQEIRQFFNNREYLEVETPCRIPAPAPEAYIEAFESNEYFLQTSPELYMKRLLASGYPKIFQICRCFRKHERGARHLPEFTMLEWYCSDSNYFDMMNESEALIKHVACKLGFEKTLIYQGKSINIDKPWERITVSKAFQKYASISIEKALSDDLFDETIAQIEHKLGTDVPVFIYDYPASCGALAKLKSSNSLLAERFELYICGIELCNAFTELTDPVEQRRRFEKELKLRKKAGLKAYPMPEKFLESLSHMPEASGNALGLDRLVMFFANAKSIDDVIAFTPEEL